MADKEEVEGYHARSLLVFRRIDCSADGPDEDGEVKVMLAVPKFHCSGHHVRTLLVMHVSNYCDDRLAGKGKFEGHLVGNFRLGFLQFGCFVGCDCFQCFGAFLRDGFLCSVCV